MVEYSAFNRIVLGSSPRHPKGYGFAGQVLATLVRVVSYAKATPKRGQATPKRGQATPKRGHSKLRSCSKFRFEFCFEFRFEFRFPEGELETEFETEFIARRARNLI